VALIKKFIRRLLVIIMCTFVSLLYHSAQDQKCKWTLFSKGTTNIKSASEPSRFPGYHPKKQTNLICPEIVCMHAEKVVSSHIVQISSYCWYLKQLVCSIGNSIWQSSFTMIWCMHIHGLLKLSLGFWLGQHLTLGRLKLSLAPD
jgi:hypothetical protein